MRASTEALIYENEKIIALMKQEDGVTEFQYFSTEWRDCNNPILPSWESPDTKFRVKPKPVKPKKPVEIWVWKYPSGLIGQGSYDNKQPDDTSGHSRVMVLMREVTE